MNTIVKIIIIIFFPLISHSADFESLFLKKKLVNNNEIFFFLPSDKKLYEIAKKNNLSLLVEEDYNRSKKYFLIEKHKGNELTYKTINSSLYTINININNHEPLILSLLSSYSNSWKLLEISNNFFYNFFNIIFLNNSPQFYIGEVNDMNVGWLNINPKKKNYHLLIYNKVEIIKYIIIFLSFIIFLIIMIFNQKKTK